MKKHLKWIIPACVIVLAAAAVLLAVLLGGSDREETSMPEVRVYWNVDKDDYWDDTLKVSTRMKSGDYYRVRFAIGGEQMDLFVDNYELMNTIDSQKFVGLRVDENNVVTQVLKPHQIGGGLAVYQYYVIEIQEDLLICNSLGSGKGLPLKLKINENTEVYDVGGDDLLVGLPTQLQVGCQIYGVYGLDGYVSHIFSMPPFEPEPVYWNVNRMYNTTAKASTRERDAAGYFTYDFVLDGEAVTLRTRSVEVANKIDAFGAKCMRLEFDEEGLISNAVHAKYSTGGSSIASWYHVLRIDSLDDPADINVVANGFYAEKFSGSDKGNTAECTLADNVKIYDMSGRGAYLGEPTELRLYDQVHCLTNPFGDVCIIFVISRPVEADLYYNLERKWDANAKTTTRTKAADGYYYFNMSVGGKKVRVKTDDVAIADIIDGRAAKVLGLTMDGDVITGAYVPGQVLGSNKTVFDYCDVVSISEDGTVTAQRKGQTYVGVITEETKIYNVSSVAGQKGEVTNIRIGDKIYGFSDFDGNVTAVYVVSRQLAGPVYWNLDRNYDTANQVTRRKPADDGYYYFKLFDGTKIVTYKTSSKSMANKLDSFVAVALDRSGDVITGVYKYDTVKGYTGGGFASWAKVTGVSGSSVQAADSKKTYSGIMAYGCRIFDVSQGSGAAVTKTSLQIGDRIHGIKNADGQIAVIYVVEREIRTELYYNVDRQWDPENATTKRTPDEEGYYRFTMAVNGQQVQLKTKELALASAIDERTARVLGLKLEGDLIQAVYKPGAVVGSENTVFDYSVVTQIAQDGTITTERNGKTYTGKPNSDCRIYDVSGLADVTGEVTQVKVGDTLYGLGDSKTQLNYIYVVARSTEKTALCPVCEQEVQWKLWDGTASLKGGHWYLDEPVTVAKTQTVSGETPVCLDLCGMEISGDSAVDRIFNIYGTMNLLDSGSTGKVVANYSNETGRTGSVFYVQNSKTGGYGELNLYGGTLTATGTTKQGGIGGIGSKFNMYGGCILDGGAADGSSLYIEATKDASVKLLGGSITGGTVFANMDITLGADVKISDLYLNGSQLTLEGLQPGAAITVTLSGGYGAFATGAAENDESYFVSAEGMDIVNTDGTLSIAAPVEKHEDHCVCGGSANGVGDHACTEQAPVWEPWTGTWESGKYYYLTADVQLSQCVEIPEHQTLNLCLNGHDLIGAGDLNRMFSVFGVLNLCDHKQQDGTFAGDLIANYDPANGDVKTGSVFYVQNRTNAALNLYGGNLTATTKLTKGAVGGVTAIFNMYDGKLYGGNVSGDGGNLYLEHEKATVNLYGGEISGGAAQNGANIYINKGTVNLKGATVSGGRSSNAGGSIRVQGAGTLNIESGLLTGGYAKGNGGNVYSIGAVNITGGTVSDGAAASGKIGGNLYASAGSLTISDDPLVEGKPAITGGSAGTGGNIAIKVDASIADCTISDGSADTGADVYYEKADGTLTLSGLLELTVYVHSGAVDDAALDEDSNVTVTTP